MDLREDCSGTDRERGENETQFADHLLSTKKARPAFPYSQSDPETFARDRRLDKRSPEAKYTYFMRDRYSGLIKIGMSHCPETRRGNLSSSGARDMEILLTLRDGCLEYFYHQHFADLRVEGEYFRPHPDIFAEIERLSAAP